MQPESIPAAAGPLRPVVVERLQADLTNPDHATAQTCARMAQHVAASLGDRGLAAAAGECRDRWVFPRGESDPFKVAAACFWWVKHRLKFEHHQAQMLAWFRDGDELQMLISPAEILKFPRPAGDCAIYAMLVGALLRLNGLDYEFVCVAADPREPAIYGHVFCRAVLPDGSRLPLDASHGIAPGWQVPARHRFRTQVFDSAGNAVADAAPVPRFHGLHAYMRQGLGQDTTVGDFPDAAPATGSNTTTLDFPNMPGSAPPAASSSSGFWNFLGGLVNQWSAIGGRVIAPTTTIQSGPGGTTISTPAGSPVPAANLSALGVGLGSGNSIMWILLALGAVVLLSRKS